MSPEWQVVTYVAAIVLFVLGAWGANSGRTYNTHALGWLGVALVTAVLLAGALKAL